MMLWAARVLARVVGSDQRDLLDEQQRRHPGLSRNVRARVAELFIDFKHIRSEVSTNMLTL
jgi:hypothetical protein